MDSVERIRRDPVVQVRQGFIENIRHILRLAAPEDLNRIGPNPGVGISQKILQQRYAVNLAAEYKGGLGAYAGILAVQRSPHDRLQPRGRRNLLNNQQRPLDHGDPGRGQ